MRILTGDETGLIKQILIEDKRIVWFSRFSLMSSKDGEINLDQTQWREWFGLVKQVLKKTK